MIIIKQQTQRSKLTSLSIKTNNYMKIDIKLHLIFFGKRQKKLKETKDFEIQNSFF
jgi:hypothetical protein